MIALATIQLIYLGLLKATLAGQEVDEKKINELADLMRGVLDKINLATLKNAIVQLKYYCVDSLQPTLICWFQYNLTVGNSSNLLINRRTLFQAQLLKSTHSSRWQKEKTFIFFRK